MRQAMHHRNAFAMTNKDILGEGSRLKNGGLTILLISFPADSTTATAAKEVAPGRFLT